MLFAWATSSGPWKLPINASITAPSVAKTIAALLASRLNSSTRLATTPKALAAASANQKALLRLKAMPGVTPVNLCITDIIT